MEIRDCLPLMTKIYLSRIVDSIFKENIPKGSEDHLIERIDQNSEYLSNPERIREVLNLKEMPRTHRILTHCILTLLLEQDNLAATEEDLFNAVIAHEQWITDKAKDPPPLPTPINTPWTSTGPSWKWPCRTPMFRKTNSPCWSDCAGS
ncbi:MAG: hypothetical protein K9K79_12940 [Desulfohalobiaceae bacterium]|nr:hypothetical protein [Desulfohalobiaceae bacterium]